MKIKLKKGGLFIDRDVFLFQDIFARINRRNTEFNTNTLTISAQHGLISQEDFFNKKIAIGNLSNYFLLYRGDFAYNRSYSVGYPMGAIKRLNLYEKGIVSSLYICFRPKDTEESDFLEQYFNSGFFNNEISKIAQEGARNHGLLNISIDDLMRAKLYLPTRATQKKIVTILKSWDNYIHFFSEYIKLKRDLKKGILQKLFTKKVSLVSRNGWSSVFLKDVLFEHERMSSGTEEVHSVSVNKGVINQIEHLGRSFSAKNTSNYKLVLPGDIVYTKSPTGEFPFGIVKQSKLTKNVITSPLYGVFTPITRNLGAILDEYFSSPVNALNYLTPLVQKGAKNTIAITNDRFLSGKLWLPLDEEEQKAISSLISLVNDEIQILEKKLNIIKAQKEYLLTGLIVGSIQTPELTGVIND